MRARACVCVEGSRGGERERSTYRYRPVSYTHLDVYKRQTYGKEAVNEDGRSAAVAGSSIDGVEWSESVVFAVINYKLLSSVFILDLNLY